MDIFDTGVLVLLGVLLLLRLVSVTRARRHANGMTAPSEPPLAPRKVRMRVHVTMDASTRGAVETTVTAALAMEECAHVHFQAVGTTPEARAAVEATVKELVSRARVIKPWSVGSADASEDTTGTWWVLEVAPGCAPTRTLLRHMVEESSFGAADVVALRAPEPGSSLPDYVYEYWACLRSRAAILFGAWAHGMAVGARLFVAPGSDVSPAPPVLSKYLVYEPHRVRDWTRVAACARAAARYERGGAMRTLSHIATSPLTLLLVHVAWSWRLSTAPLALTLLAEWFAPSPRTRRPWLLAAPVATAAVCMDLVMLCVSV